MVAQLVGHNVHGPAAVGGRRTDRDRFAAQALRDPQPAALEGHPAAQPHAPALIVGPVGLHHPPDARQGRAFPRHPRARSRAAAAAPRSGQLADRVRCVAAGVQPDAAPRGAGLGGARQSLPRHPPALSGPAAAAALWPRRSGPQGPGRRLVSCQGRHLRLPKASRGQAVAFRPTSTDGSWTIRFLTDDLGTLDLREPA